MMNALQFEAVKIALKQDRNGFVLTLNIHPDEIPDELLRDFVGARYGVAMVRINEDETPVQVSNRVQKAGMLCKDHWFFRYLEANHDFGKATEQKAVRFIYETCGIQSRVELNGNIKAQECFDQLIKEFNEWREHNDPF